MKAIGIEIVRILERGLLSAHHLVCLLPLFVLSKPAAAHCANTPLSRTKNEASCAELQIIEFRGNRNLGEIEKFDP